MPLRTRSLVRIGPLKLTRYEKARIIGARALQISLGAPVLIKLPPHVKDPIEIALLELKAKVLPIIVRRRLPNNTYQDIPLKYLEIS
ncbi:MAG: DNA-directed RNA polymerase subunit K [Thermoprotei archaeon]|nr:MAG: DNA-directed RNA polymerase subunit K [Thermoprotei archaeon]RLF02870.1 MAG: DNA-directed RNA polymerase subunit K [Thermoprotei archaeon]